MLRATGSSPSGALAKSAHLFERPGRLAHVLLIGVRNHWIVEPEPRSRFIGVSDSSAIFSIDKVFDDVSQI